MKRLVVVGCALFCASFGLFAQTRYTPPNSSRSTCNFNVGWRFFKGDVKHAERIDLDDSKWLTVSTPHTYNDTDTYDELITHRGGERHQYMGVAWYRKHFKLPAGRHDGREIEMML
jgi:beta-galactosidase